VGGEAAERAPLRSPSAAGAALTLPRGRSKTGHNLFFQLNWSRVCSVKAQVKLSYSRNSAHLRPNKYLSWHQPKHLRPDRLTGSLKNHKFNSLVMKFHPREVLSSRKIISNIQMWILRVARRGHQARRAARRAKLKRNNGQTIICFEASPSKRGRARENSRLNISSWTAFPALTTKTKLHNRMFVCHPFVGAYVAISRLLLRDSWPQSTNVPCATIYCTLTLASGEVRKGSKLEQTLNT
jgi:hypothetical protein